MTKRFGIIGVTITGNMGGQAMLEATLEQMRLRVPDARYTLFSITPDKDRRVNTHPDLDIVAIPPLRLLTLDLAVSALCMILPVGARWGLPKRVSSCDAMIDLSGIAFVDGRGFPLLIYNMAVCLPSFAARTPHHKMAQAVGPFHRPLNRWVARFILRRCASVAARGEVSRRHLQALGISSSHQSPDVSFALTVGKAHIDQARTLAPADHDWSSCVAISPSRVVEIICRRHNVDYLGTLAAFARDLVERGFSILVVPHSLASGKSKNNDLEIAARLSAALHGLAGVFSPPVPADARVLRALYGLCNAVVTSRFHSAVAAASTGVPVITLSWSHKYEELLSPFGLAPLVLPAEKINLTEIQRLWHVLESGGLALRQQIAAVAIEHAKRAVAGFDYVTARPSGTRHAQ